MITEGERSRLTGKSLPHRRVVGQVQRPAPPQVQLGGPAGLHPLPACAGSWVNESPTSPSFCLLNEQMRGLGEMLWEIPASSNFHDPIIYFMPRFPT